MDDPKEELMKVTTPTFGPMQAITPTKVGIKCPRHVSTRRVL